MYYQANDNELIYLIREGNTLAYRALYKKYEHLIYKFYKENMESNGVLLHDFMQEGLMCLEKAIHIYQEKYKCSFYSFFILLLRRNSIRLSRKNDLSLREKSTEYKKENSFISRNSRSFLLETVVRELNLKNQLEKDIFYDGILNSVKIADIARKHASSYQSVYMKYKKIKQKVEKILTNA
ncbi:MAG: hypothetical protein K2J93_06350 [Anaeroplasmataceae bacterium]|nr:hypothetical protein [Anaeroplasmataceae bacterium]